MSGVCGCADNTVMDAHRPDLSSAEKEYHREVHELDRRTKQLFAARLERVRDRAHVACVRSCRVC